MSRAPANLADVDALPPGPVVSPDTSSGAEVSRPAAEGGLPVAGEIWRGLYRIVEDLGEVAGARAWAGERVAGGERVVLRALNALRDGARAKAWQALEALDHPHLERVAGVHEVGTTRVEVQPASTAETLGAWRQRGAVDASTLERFVQSMAGALGALHERGLVHGAIRPQHIFVQEENGVPQFRLGGFQTATLFGQAELVRLTVDPFYAPPEAAGLFQHSPGPHLCAWDWWSLGRVVQELILGQHVLGLVLRRDVSRVGPELTTHAEQLLLEREAGAMRAGAVEAMPAMDLRVEQLLRGLLASSRDARWNGESVAAWLRGESVREYYRLSRNERLFRWHDRALTVAEAAERMRSAANWREAVEQVWEVQQPGTLAHFLADSTAHRPLFERQEELRKLATVFALKTFAPEIVRDVIAAVALLELVGTRLVWRGEGFDAEGLRKIFGSEAGDPDRFALLQAFAARPVVLSIERSDLAAARAVTELGQTAAGAATLLRAQRWIKESDAAGHARLLQHAVRAPAELQAAVKELRERCPCSTNAAVEKLFKLPHPARAELVALLWLADEAEKHGFLTQVQWAEREAARLRASGEEQVAALAWMALGRALARGPWWFARWRSAVPMWLGCAAVLAFLWPGPRWIWVAAGVVVLTGAVRVVASRWLRGSLRRRFPASAPWRLTDGAARCHAEVLALRVGWVRADLVRAWQTVNDDLAKLTALQPVPAPVAPPPRFAGVWAVSLAGWILLAAVVGLGGWRAKTHRPSIEKFVTAWNPPQTPEEIAATAAVTATAARRTAADEDAANGPVKVSWPYKAGDEAEVLLVVDSAEATSAQLRYLADRGRKFVEPYKPATIDSLLVFRVPTEGKFGVMLYNGRERQMPNLRVYLLDYPPMPRAWVEVAGRKAIFIPD